MSADEGERARNLSRRKILLASTTLAAASALGTATAVSTARAQQSAASGKQPNILVIMGDDVGWFNIGAYHQGIMSGKTPNLDKLAAEGIRFTDYYAEASCTAGRANFITGQIPLRTGLTTVGQAGADVGMPDQSVTTALIKAAGKPFFIWHNTTRMHVFTYLSQKYQAKMNFQSNFGLEEAGMAQMDDDIGDLLKHLDDIGVADNTIVIFTTDNGAEVFTWPDGGMTPFRATKGTVFEGGFRVPCIARWPAKIKPGTVQNGIFSGLDWLPTLVAAAGNPNIVQHLLQGVELGGRTYKNHLDGYNQMDLLTGKGPSARHEIFYFGESQLGAIRIDDFKFQFYQQPFGWPGEKVATDMPTIVNLRQDPFERTPSIRGQTLNDQGGGYMNDFMAREFWRFVQVQQTVAAAAQSFVDFPPMQQAASFNLQAVKEKVEQMMKSHEGQ